MLTLFAAAIAGVLAAGEFQTELTGEKKPWTHERFLNEKSRFTFIIVPDRTGNERPGVFQEAIRKANLLQPHFIITVGDLIQGMMDKDFQSAEHLRAQWRELTAITARSEAPFFYVVGNHDICRTRPGFPRANETSRKVWEEFLGDRTYYYFIYRNVLFLCLNCMEGQDARDPQTSVTAAQLQWAKDVLAKHPDVAWTFLFVHQPNFWGSDEFEELEKVLVGRKYTAFAGDWHHYLKVRRQGRNYYVLGTAGGVSKLRGVEYGEFDHLTHVTVTPKGPVVVNLKLDGIVDEDAVTAANIRRPVRCLLDDPPLEMPSRGVWNKTIDEKWLARMIREQFTGGRLVLRDGAIRVDGDPTAKNNRWRAGSIPLDFPNPAGKKLRLTADIRTHIANAGQGQFHVRVRMARAGNRTIDYVGFIVKESQPWTRMTVDLVMRDNTVATQLYVVGVNLDADSWGEVRNITLEEVEKQTGSKEGMQ